MPSSSSVVPPHSLPPSVLACDSKGVARAAQLIKGGKLVVVPTETVYGIAVNLLSAEARAAAKKIKSAGGASPPWVIHVAQPEDVLGWAPHLSTLGRRLVAKALPGPVAFQIKLTDADLAAARTRLGAAADETLQDGFLTIRCPDFSCTQQVLFEAGVPVAIIGAGTASQPAVFEVGDLPESLRVADAGSQTPAPIDAAVDGGPTRYRRSSTLVRIEGEKFSVIRPGVIDERIIQKMADFNILFIYSGNTCRSPMAAALATRLLADKLRIEPSELTLRHVVVQSAGLHANRGLRATVEAVEAVKSHGADLSSHISQPATIDLLRRADLIYTMTEAHRDEVLELVPGAGPKTHRLDPDADVDDPIGAGQQVYEEVAGHLVNLLKGRLREVHL